MKKQIENYETILSTHNPVIVKAPEDVPRYLIAFGKDKTKKGTEISVVYRISEEKLIRSKAPANQDIRNLILTKASNPTGRIPVLERIIRENHEIKIPATTHRASARYEYFETIKTNGKAFIPGSSIKGAILTALINKTVISLWNKHNSFSQWLEKQIQRGRPRKTRFLNNTLLALAKADLFKELKTSDFKGRISDSTLKKYSRFIFKPWLQISDTDLHNPEKFCYCYLGFRAKDGTVSGDINEDGIIEPICIEAIRPNKELSFSITTMENEIDPKAILNVVHSHYSKVFKEEKQWYKEKNINVKLPKETPLSLIRIGWGSGLDALSLLPALRELDEDLLETYVNNLKLTRNLDLYPNSKWIGRWDVGKVIFHPFGWAHIRIT